MFFKRGFVVLVVLNEPTCSIYGFEIPLIVDRVRRR